MVTHEQLDKQFQRLSKTALRVKAERDALVTGICNLAQVYAQAGETILAYKTFVQQLHAILADAGIRVRS